MRGGGAEWQMPISRAKVGVSIDQQANTGGLIHHFVFHCREGDPHVLPMRGHEGMGSMRDGVPVNARPR